ncbi:inositol monophosphatase family protein [Fulvivirga lutimaris]|uniref:inositol monophosphatase family protein n=1 Tax=Fulvivirga lutimaris TaxID=1819566 RepID=UPI0012BB49E3|nr:inositol monophosphatase family protein [Fulvivirga lutimaris]MTI40365.1 inositol monophosphatase [Fulvivirga lutimaris]
MNLLPQILDQLRPVILQTGQFIRDEAMSFSTDKIEHKGFNDLVSYVDKQAEIQLVEGCHKILPEAGFITEEGTSTKKSDEYNWIIDPLDGTTNFTHGLPIYSISVALMQNEKIVLGVVYEINKDEFFHAIDGLGAFCNGETISVSNNSMLKDSLLATGFPYANFEGMDAYLSILNSLMQCTHGLRRMGSAAVDLAYVACGRFEGFFEYNLNSYDVAAGTLIVKEAGGIVSDFSGGYNYIFGGEIVAANAVHSELLNIIKKEWNNSKG